MTDHRERARHRKVLSDAVFAYHCKGRAAGVEILLRHLVRELVVKPLVTAIMAEFDADMRASDLQRWADDGGRA